MRSSCLPSLSIGYWGFICKQNHLCSDLHCFCLCVENKQTSPNSLCLWRKMPFKDGMWCILFHKSLGSHRHNVQIILEDETASPFLEKVKYCYKLLMWNWWALSGMWGMSWHKNHWLGLCECHCAHRWLVLIAAWRTWAIRDF